MTTPVAPRGYYHSTLNTTNVLSKCTINPSKKRPDHTTDSRDIKESGPRQHQAVITRHVDPNEPRYRLPSFEEQLPEPPPLKYNFAHDISDIVGYCHRSKLATTCLGRVREEVRPELTKCDDISYYIKAESSIKPHEKDTNLDISDIVGKKARGFDRKKSDMLNGRYDWKGAEEIPSEGLSQTRQYQREMLDRRDYRIHDQMRTDDVAGLKEERERKLRFKYGYNREIRNVTYAEDCTCGDACCSHKHLERSLKFTEKATDASADQIGQEYKECNTKEFYYKPPTVEQTYGNPEFFKAGAVDKGAPSVETGYLTLNTCTEPQKGSLHPPEYVIAPPEIVCRKRYAKTTDPRLIPSAGMNLRGHEFACKNECVGQLPGPGAEFYHVRSNFGRRTAQGIGSWIKRCDPNNYVSGFETTWNQREVSKLGDYWQEQQKTTLREYMGLAKTATQLLSQSKKFDNAPPRTFCGYSVTMRTISASYMRCESVVPVYRPETQKQGNFEASQGFSSSRTGAAKTARDIEAEAVANLPW